MDIGKILTRAWQISWRNKVLWFFGFLMALTSGGGGSGGGNGNTNFQNTSPNPPTNVPPTITPPSGQFPAFDQSAVALVAVIVCCLALIFLVLVFYVRFVARGALITGTRDADAGAKITIGSAWREGSKHYGRLLGLGVLVNLPLTVLGLLVILIALVPIFPLIMTSVNRGTMPDLQFFMQQIGSVAALLLFIFCAVLVLALITLVIHPIYEFAARAIVLDGAGVTESLGKSWQHIRANFGSVAILYLVLIGLRIGFGIATVIVLIPIVVIFGGAVVVGAMTMPVWTVLALLVCVAIPVGLFFVFLEGLFVTYENVTWTLGYASLSQTPAALPAPTEPAQPLATS